MKYLFAIASIVLGLLGIFLLLTGKEYWQPFLVSLVFSNMYEIEELKEKIKK